MNTLKNITPPKPSDIEAHHEFMMDKMCVKMRVHGSKLVLDGITDAINDMIAGKDVSVGRLRLMHEQILMNHIFISSISHSGIDYINTDAELAEAIIESSCEVH